MARRCRRGRSADRRRPGRGPSPSNAGRSRARTVPRLDGRGACRAARREGLVDCCQDRLRSRGAVDPPRAGRRASSAALRAAAGRRSRNAEGARRVERTAYAGYAMDVIADQEQTIRPALVKQSRGAHSRSAESIRPGQPDGVASKHTAPRKGPTSMTAKKSDRDGLIDLTNSRALRALACYKGARGDTAHGLLPADVARLFEHHRGGGPQGPLRRRPARRAAIWRACAACARQLLQRIEAETSAEPPAHRPARAGPRRVRRISLRAARRRIAGGGGAHPGALRGPRRGSLASSRAREKKYIVCVSSQAGCALACSFCSTGAVAFAANLDLRRDGRPGAGGAHRGGSSPVRGIVFTWAWASRS